MRNLYIVDLDGTVCDCRHRLHHILNENPDWDKFHELCVLDTPIQAVIDVINAIHGDINSKAHFLYLTGRMEKNRTPTHDWIGTHGLPLVHADLVMRKDGDHRKDEVIKPELLAEFLAGENTRQQYKVVAAFEDRPAMCRKWREMGFTVFQMNHEEF